MCQTLNRRASASPLKANLAHWQRQYLYFIAALFLLLPALGVAIANRDIDEWYARTVLGPPLERELGFHMELGPHPAYPDHKGNAHFIRHVEPGGVFERAGFQVWDTPDRRCSICTHDIYRLLEWNRGGYAEIDVFRRPYGSLARPELVTLRVRVPERSRTTAQR